MDEEMDSDYNNDRTSTRSSESDDDQPAEELETMSSSSYPSLEDERVRDAVDGLMLLSEVNPASPPPPPPPPLPPIISSEEVSPCSLECKTWDCKNTRSVIHSCSAPPPSPENEQMAELYRMMDGLLHRKAVFEQGTQKIKIHQDEQRAFNEKLRKKNEESDTSVPIAARVYQIPASQLGDQAPSSIKDSAECHQNGEPLRNGDVAALVTTEVEQPRAVTLQPNPLSNTASPVKCLPDLLQD